MSVKLNNANATLSKWKRLGQKKTLKSVYHAIFESHLCILVQKTLIQSRDFIYYRTNSSGCFMRQNSRTGPLFKDSEILKSFDKAVLKNCIFIAKSLKRLLPFVFNSWFRFSSESHSYSIRWTNIVYLKILSYQTKSYGRG